MKVFFSLSEGCTITDEMQSLLAKLVDYEGLISLAVRDYNRFIQTAVISSEETGVGSLPPHLLVSIEGDSEAFQREIERIQLLTGIETVLLTVRPHELKECIRTNSGARWIEGGKWKLLAGKADDLIPDELDKESGISEPDLFSGTGFTW